MRRYDDPVEVRKGRVSGIEAPEQFLWRGRLWKVRAVLAHWVETGPWWQSSGVRAMLGSDDVPAETTGTEQAAASRSLGQLMAERELWRVEAGRGPVRDGGGVFDLSFDSGNGRWQLVGCVD
ncbi:MAG: hypothetical protein H0V42_07005 [Nocardioidaceae bacterium]|nr:hypothetical protein [Nocardioidaceae bacterium]